MKKHATKLLAVMLIALPALLSAQTRVIKAQVPFEFTANGVTMPAGSCSVEARGDGPAILMITSGEQHLFVLPNAMESTKVSENASLVFHKYGDRYFLASINRAGSNRGYELPTSKVEAELRAQNVVEDDVTLLASVR